MTAFPLTRATSLALNPGSHPIKTYRAQNGATRTRVFGSLPVGSGISAQFRCTSAQAASVWAVYHADRSGALPTQLPSALFSGHAELLAAFPANVEWFMREPQVDPIKNGLVDLSVEFEGRMEV